MDLIYADENGKEIGSIMDYALDVAFGKDENSFELQLDLDNHCCNDGYFVYLDGTEYGGIVDKIEPDTEKQKVIYEGRTWHGIINGKIIEPEDGQDYLYVSGNANTVLAELITMLGLDAIFTVSDSVSDVVIDYYKFERYTPAYVGILNMLLGSNGKLSFLCKNGKVILDAVPLYDYSRDEEWDSSQMNLSIVKDYRPVNHLICLGSGNLSDRNVIHLFADENGGVQPYTSVDDPYKNAHYILDKSQQVLFGINEVEEVYDYGNAQDTLNYVLLSEQPSNWNRTYPNYYRKENDEFRQLEREYEDAYAVLSSSPGDWANNYGDYFYKSGNTYRSVCGVESESYTIQKSKPADWAKNYGNYFFLWSDGTTSEYRSASGDTKYKYVAQTMKPSDWKSNYKNYYEKVCTVYYRVMFVKLDASGIWRKGYEIITSLDDMVNTPVKKYTNIQSVMKYEYRKISDKKVPTWKAKRYYTRKSYSVAPTWKSSYFYTKSTTTVAPKWETGKYYDITSKEKTPVFSSDKYYELFIDNYADLVAHGIKKMEKYYNCDSISINLDASQEYDINDIVGAKEEKTGINIFQPITKKIVKFSNNQETIEYEIGE